MKRATLILSIVAILLLIVGAVLTGSAVAGCTTATGQASCSGSAGSAAIGGILSLIGGIAAVVAWILGIIKTATIKRWGWFVVVLLLGTLGTLIYGAAGPDQPAA